jgi:hypothetical protein
MQKRRRTEENEELTEARAAVMERRRAPRRRFNLPRHSPGEKRRRCHRRRCQTSSSVGAGVEQVDGGASSLFSWSGGGAQETEEQRKKTMAWGKKSRFTPAPVFIPRDQGRGDRGKCSTTPTVSAGSHHVAAWSGAAVPITVPLGNDGTQ